jgi:predicted RNase H-like nuclease (RuvC/YqgF family)
MAASRTVQLLALIGALAVGVAVYLYVSGMAGGFYAAAALIFGLFLHARLKTAEESTEPAAGQAASPAGNRWTRRRATLAALERELEAERARVSERDNHVDVLRRELEEQRMLAGALELRFTRRLAEVEALHEEEVARVVAALPDLERELTAVEQLVDDLEARARGRRAEESPHEGAAFQVS